MDARLHGHDAIKDYFDLGHHKTGNKDMAESAEKVITLPIERITSRIFLIRQQKVMLDFDLAELYNVTTKRLNEQVTRNIERFPDDFMFRLTQEETEQLNQSQFATGSQKHRDPRYPPRAFTQEGVAMLSGLLRSKTAIDMNISIMRAFVRLREMLASNEELAQKVAQHDRQIANLFKYVERLMMPSQTKKKHPIGFIYPKEDGQ